MKSINLFSGAILIAILLLSIRCQKEDESPYTLYDGNLNSAGYCSVVTAAGDLYIVGTRGADILVMKTNLNGKLTWEKTYNLFGSAVNNNGWTIEETYDDCFLISAYHSWDTYYNGLLKINASGDSIWSVILQDSGHVALKAVVETADHNIIVLHEEEKDVYLDLHLITISKISPNGVFIESKPYPELLTPEVWIDGWQASEDGNVMITVRRYNQAASVWTINNLLDVTSQESFQYGKEIAYFTGTPGQFICADQVYDHSTHLYLNKAMPGNNPDWEQDILMPCVGWAYHTWAGPAAEGYLVMGTLWDEKKSQYYMHNTYCMALDAEGNQTWLWYDDVSIYGVPYNFHFLSEDEYLIVGRQRGNADDYIVIWRLKNGSVIN